MLAANVMLDNGWLDFASVQDATTCDATVKSATTKRAGAAVVHADKGRKAHLCQVDDGVAELGRLVGEGQLRFLVKASGRQWRRIAAHSKRQSQQV